MATLVSRRTKRAIKRKDQKLANTNYATKWAGVTQAAPSSVGGTTATRYKSYTTSVSSVAIAESGTKTFTVGTGGAHLVNDYIFFVAASDSTKWMAGNVTAYDSGTGVLSFNVTASSGTGTFTSWVVGGPIANGRSYFGDIKFVGTDSETGFALPAGSPFYATTSTAFGIQFIDWYDGFATNDAAGLAASASTDFEQVTIAGVTTTALVIDQKQPTVPIDGVGYRKQTWAMLYRDTTTGADLPRLLTWYDLWINDLTGKLTTTNRRVNIWEMKTVTDFRYVVTIIMADATDAAEFGVAVGTIGWEIIGDNKAASLTSEEFFRFKNFTDPVPQGEFVDFLVYWVRGKSYADEESGRFVVKYKLKTADEYVTVCDYNAQSNIGYNSAHPGQAKGNSPATDCRNIHMGEDASKPQRIFFCGVYGKYEWTNMKVKCANLRFYDNFLPATSASAAVILGILHGPQSYTPTVPTGVVKYVSPTGTGVGTFTDPMSIADANDSALPGDHFWLRDGTYTIPLNGIRFYEGGTSWAPGKYVTYESYPGEQAVFDGAANQAEEADVRVKFQNTFVCLRKVEIKNCSLQGVEMAGTDNKIEFCEIHDCWLSGILAAVSGGTASHPYVNGRNIIRSNTIYNCSDVGHLTGSYANGGNADAISITSGIGNIVEYNLCYNCSDDGIDVWRSTGTRVVGNLSYGMGLGDGNGNGFKCGGSPSGTTYSTDHIFAYNISVGNKSSGFSGNNGVRTYLYHNTTSGNPVGYDDFDSTTRLVGNIAAEATRYTGSTAGHSGNSWDVAVGTTPTFISTDSSSADYYKPPAGNMFEDIGAYAAREAVLSYNDATFYAPLKTSLVLDAGTGSPTLTRATAMRVFDNEDKMITVPASAAAFGGARMVRNWFTDTDNMSGSANWAVSNMSKTAALDPAGAAGAVLCTCTANSGNYIRQTYTSEALGGNTRTVKFLYYPGTADWMRMMLYSGASTDRASLWFNATTHALGANSTGGTGWAYVSSSLTASVAYPGWYEVSLVVTSPETGTHVVHVGMVDANSSFTTTAVNNKTLTIALSQLENTTGQTDKTPSEYVVGDNGAGVTNLKYYATNKDGTAIPDADLLGLATIPAAVTNTMLHCRDFTNAAWVKTNTTAAKDQIGLDKAANSCSLLTATAANATILQTITAAAAAGCTGFYVKRSVGTGIIEITRDNGTTWTDVTSLINGSTFTLVGIENTSVTNPVVGFRIGTSGDAIIVDGGINHLGTKLYQLPIITTTAAVTVNAQTLTYPTSGNISDTSGTIMATVQQDTWSAGGVVGSATHGLFASDATSGVQAKDGTNTASGKTATPTGSVKLGCRWSGSSLEAFSATTYLSVGTATSYDGSLNLSTISVGAGVAGYVKDVAIYV